MLFILYTVNSTFDDGNDETRTGWTLEYRRHTYKCHRHNVTIHYEQEAFSSLSYILQHYK